MAKNEDKLKTNRIREQIHKQYVSRLKARDETIAGLMATNAILEERVKRLEENAALDMETIRQLNELADALQIAAKLNDDELETLKSEIARRKQNQKAFSDIVDMMTAMSRALGPTYRPR